MKFLSGNSICFIRANHWNITQAIPRSIEASEELFKNIYILCWNRDKSDLKKYEIVNFHDKNIYIYRFSITAPPRSLRIVIITIIFQLWIFVKLISIRAHFVQPLDFESAIPSLFASILTLKKLIYDIRDPIVYTYQLPKLLLYIIYFIDWLIIGLSTGIVVPGEDRVTYLGIWKTKKSLAIIQNTCPDEFDKVLQKISDSSSNEKPIISYIGYIDKIRGADLLLNLAKSNRNIEIHVAGTIRSNELLEDIKNSPIIYLGKLPRIDTLCLMMKSSAISLLYDSSLEINKLSAPNKFYEAMCMGTPVIVSEGMNISRIVKEHNLGWVIPYNNFEALVLVVRDLFNKEIQDKKRKCCREFYLIYGSYDKLIKTYKEFYMELIRK